MNDFRFAVKLAPQKAGIKRGGRKVAHDRTSLFAFLA